MENIVFDSVHKDPASHPKLLNSEGVPISSDALLLVNSYITYFEKQKSAGSQLTIKVGEVLSSLAFLYERVRNALDYKNENLLMRNTIERIITRKYLEKEEVTAEGISQSLIRELIWAKYLKNDSLPKSKQKQLTIIIDKYLDVLKYFNSIVQDGKERARLRKWFVSVASSEIEEALNPLLYLKIEALARGMFSWFREKFDWQGIQIDEDTKEKLLNVSVHRSLFKSDEARLRYHLLKHYFVRWDKFKIEDAKTIDIISIINSIESLIHSPLQPRLYRFVQKLTAPFQVLDDIIIENPEGAKKLFTNQSQLEKKVRKVCDHHYGEIGKKVNRGIVRSIIYIFVTKVVLALIIEVPYEYYFVGELAYTPLAINLLIPPFLMFLFGITIRKPGSENTKRIIEKINDFVYVKENEERFILNFSASEKKQKSSSTFVVIYAIVFVAVFSLISGLLFLLGFNIISALLFYMFLSLVLLFAYRVRFMASELNLTAPREDLLSHILTNLTLPFLNIGVWLSSQLLRLSFLLIIMDFLIEAPLKKIMGVIEEWTSFIREKKEEVVEVPN